MKHKAIFIDKDGTLVKDIPYNVNPALVEFEDGALEGLKILQENNYKLIVVSNQSGVARGYFAEEALEGIKNKIQSELLRVGVQLDDFYFCPHHPCGIVDKYAYPCSCRKPEPGMILSAAEKYTIDLSRSWMIGDILHDVEAGNRAGCRTILINNGNETEWENGRYRYPTFMTENILSAVEIIVSMENYCIENENRISEASR